MSFAKGDVLIVVGARAPAGKTKLIEHLAEELRTSGLTPVALKPVETSCPGLPNHDIGSRDGPALQSSSGSSVPLPVVAPYRFRGHGTVLEAARAAGLDLRLSDLVTTLGEAARYGDVLIVEASGAALDPIAEDGSALDLAARVAGKLVVLSGGDRPTDVQNRPLLEEARAKGLSVIERAPV